VAESSRAGLSLAERLAGAQSNAQVHRADAAALRDEVTVLKAEARTAAEDHRAHLTDLERTIQTPG
jgi:hypothetical protein